MIVADPQRAEAALAAGELGCPNCGGALRAWAHARTRRIRGLPDPVRPRRALCPSCGRSQVLLPGALLPRRADATEVVGAALVAKAAGKGHRQIAADLQRPESTVRRWLRATRTPQHLAWIHHRATVRLIEVAPQIFETFTRFPPLPEAPLLAGPLADALGALAVAVSAIRGRFPEITASAWALISVITGGRLLLPAPSG
jgi:hypothetical protein